MFDVDAFLDRAKAAAGVTSDYALGVKVLGYKHTTTVTNWRSGRSVPDERAIMKLCALTGDDPEHVAACLQSMRAANDDAAELWRRVAERLRQGGAASIAFTLAAALIVLAALHGGPVLAQTARTSVYYVECFAILRLVWRLAKLAPAWRTSRARLTCSP